jgi:mannose-6-phosphate isomerase-like protein (cupin superfamily)
MPVGMNQLRELSDLIIRNFRAISKSEFNSLLNMQDYDGFKKSSLPESFIGPLLEALRIEPTDVQVELIQVERDLANEIHFHAHADTFVVILGRRERVEKPWKAFAFQRRGGWIMLSAGDKLEIPRNTPHGFTVGIDGRLCLLSVLSPPVASEDHHLVDG